MSERELMGEEEWLRQRTLQKKYIPHNTGPKKIISPWILDFIKHHALSSAKEIYGWLIGRETTNGDLVVLTAVACQRYQMQTYIGAAPDPREVQELSTALPNGVGMIGIYHSHPADIFHSSVDDKTLQNLARYYPKMISAVANSDAFDEEEKNHTRWFQLSSDGISTEEIEMTKEISPLDHFRWINSYCKLTIDANISLSGQINQVLLKKIMSDYETIWKKGNFYFLNEKPKRRAKYLREKIKNGLVPNDSSKSLFDNDVIKIKSKYSMDRLPKNALSSMYKKKRSFYMDFSYNTPLHNSPTEDTPLTHIYGDLYLSFHQILNSQKEENQEQIISKIKAEVMDMIIQSLSRSLFLPHDDSSLEIISPTPINIPYPGLPMMLNILNEHIPSLTQEISQVVNSFNDKTILKSQYFPNVDQIHQQDDNILQSMFKRAKYLIFSGKSIESVQILSLLSNIYNVRGNLEKRDEVLQIIQLIQQ